MRRSFNKNSGLAAILAQTGGVDPTTGEKVKVLRGYNRGAKFYLELPNFLKRVKGKWRVKR